jgi:hypothetical protein
MALVVGEVDALLGLGRAALPAGLCAGQRADQPQQEEAHQLGQQGGEVVAHGLIVNWSGKFNAAHAGHDGAGT